ncbi:SYFA ligase, partial [Chloropsis cyanopogon]|nr:SYFA ligase [Chloropsis cyanopogon]
LPERERAELKRRKLLLEVSARHVRACGPPPGTPGWAPPGPAPTPDPSFRGSWRRLPFKPYNFCSLGLPPACGHLHPLLKVRSELRQIFLEMG